MKDPWTCPICGEEMWKGLAHSNYIACPRGHGKLHPAPRVKDLPTASRATWQSGRHFPFTKLYYISGDRELWKYVSRAHKTALDKRPGPGVVVASIRIMGGRVEARAFRRAGRQSNDRR